MRFNGLTIRTGLARATSREPECNFPFRRDQAGGPVRLRLVSRAGSRTVRDWLSGVTVASAGDGKRSERHGGTGAIKTWFCEPGEWFSGPQAMAPSRRPDTSVCVARSACPGRRDGIASGRALDRLSGSGLRAGSAGSAAGGTAGSEGAAGSGAAAGSAARPPGCCGPLVDGAASKAGQRLPSAAKSRIRPAPAQMLNSLSVHKRCIPGILPQSPAGAKPPGGRVGPHGAYRQQRPPGHGRRVVIRIGGFAVQVDYRTVMWAGHIGPHQLPRRAVRTADPTRGRRSPGRNGRNAGRALAGPAGLAASTSPGRP